MRFAVSLLIWVVGAIALTPSVSAQRIRRVTGFVPIDVANARIDDSGNRVVAWWRGDPLGTTPNRLFQLFLWDDSAGTTTRVGSMESDVCLETNSVDTSIAGFEDSLQPTAGQTLFYLFRGRMGPTEPPANWGSPSSGGSRTATAGSCSDAPM